MNGLYGLIYAFRSSEKLGELVAQRTSAAIPVCGRYRAIDFSLSMLTNAGARGVGVIMQKNYQSLLDHLGSGKEWDLSRHSGGLQLLPPFGLPEARQGDYRGCMEALSAVGSVISEVKQEHVALMHGNMVANVDLEDVLRAHVDSGADVTAVCRAGGTSQEHNEFMIDSGGRCTKLLCGRKNPGEGFTGLSVYIVKRQALLRLIADCEAQGLRRFHRDALQGFINGGGHVRVYVSPDYARHINTVGEYMAVNMDMLEKAHRDSLFPVSRPVRSKERADVSTYYGRNAVSRRSLIADGCFIEGDVEECVIFSGVRLGRGAILRRCVVMQDCIVGEQSILKNVIADKTAQIGPYTTLTGSRNLPLVIPKAETV